MRTPIYPLPSRAILRLLLAGSVLVLSLQQGKAIIDINLQMQLGNPTGATADATNQLHHLHYLIQHPQYALDYSDTNRQPNWVSWDLTAGDVGSSGRTDAWAVETNVPSDFHPVPTSTFGSVNSQSYDRGHMCPSADRTDTVADNEKTFIMSNIIPQASQNNQGLWATFENYSRTLISSQELLIISGPSNFGTNRILSGGHAAIASNVWKIVVCVPLGAGTALSRITNTDPNSIRVIALNTPNDASVSSKTWTTFVTSTKQIQQETGYNFFSALPNNLAWVLRSKVDGQSPASPGSISFSPQNGPVGTSVTITGANLDSITNVTFNGIRASYDINSPTQITALVPAVASSGPVSVRGLGGNVVGSSNFIVTTGTVSPFPITAARFVGPNRFVITWTSVSSHTYQVQSATSVAAGNWTTNATLTATASSSSWTNLAASGACEIYRVVDTP
ncbi:MAG: DNA/RNA non-specific endonuclease [Acidobacteria bacterium]|nr:DNA/RNA non-specific endonuclease [Acidobacteriota bacterium]